MMTMFGVCGFPAARAVVSPVLEKNAAPITSMIAAVRCSEYRQTAFWIHLATVVPVRAPPVRCRVSSLLGESSIVATWLLLFERSDPLYVDTACPRRHREEGPGTAVAQEQLIDPSRVKRIV